ncbi:MAG: hypothetical protein WB767_16940, partial [Nocardioides sp.]
MPSPRPHRFTRVAALVLGLGGAGLVLAPSQAVAVEPAPAPPSDPSWQVVTQGPGSFAVSWTSPRELPVTSDRPTIAGGGLTFGPSTIAADQRTVTAVVTAPVAPDMADLDVLLSGDRLDEPGLDG